MMDNDHHLLHQNHHKDLVIDEKLHYLDFSTSSCSEILLFAPEVTGCCLGWKPCQSRFKAVLNLTVKLRKTDDMLI